MVGGWSEFQFAERRMPTLEELNEAAPDTPVFVLHLYDRALLNRAVGGILHLEDRKLTFYQGPYDTFATTRAARIAGAEAANRRTEAQRAHLQKFVDRFRYKASKAVQAQSRLKMIERLKPISTPQEAALKRFTFPQPEELSPPIVVLENVAVGYNGKAVLKRLNLRIDQDDRIALLGRNGEGKSTIAKLLSARLKPLDGRITTAGKLRVGYFAQHQVDELFVDETPIEHIRRLRPNELPGRLRARLGGFGIGAEQAETLVGRLSGGQKARLSLMLATLDAPHMLILDEPTNHLDIESREALVDALTAYTGAVILVSHDMHLLSLVADRLWLIKDGHVAPYEDDLQSYRKMLLSNDRPAGKPKQKPVSRNAGTPLPALRSQVRSCEARVEKLNLMRDRLAGKLAAPELYEDGKIGAAGVWQK
ncbi:MAG: ATP-binding cassette domain-containing protein, partial [Paracoccaceae bacterium]